MNAPDPDEIMAALRDHNKASLKKFAQALDLNPRNKDTVPQLKEKIQSALLKNPALQGP